LPEKDIEAYPLKGLSLQNDGGQAKRKNTPSSPKIYFLIES
jgi:hypothetical protein